MGFLADVFSIVRATLVVTGEIVRATVKAVREISATALIWMGETGEAVVGGVKKFWSAVRPYVDHARKALRHVAAHSSIDWLAAAAHGVERVLAALTAFERSPIAHLIDWLLNWMIRKGKELKRRAESQALTDVDATEVAEAEQAREALRIVSAKVPVQHRADLKPASALADILLVAGKLGEILARDGIEQDFDFYLRARATQKLLSNIRAVNTDASNPDDKVALDDDYFLVEIAQTMIDRSAELSPENAARLDAILLARTGMRLDAFVLEELVPVFEGKRVEAQQKWDDQNIKVGQARARRSLFTNDKEAAFDKRISDSAQRDLDALNDDLPSLEAKLKLLDEEKDFAFTCAGAAEGLVKLLEQSLEQLSEDEIQFIHDEVSYVGPLLTRCFKKADGWSDLDSDQRDRLIEYALSHNKAMEERLLKLRT